MKTFGYIAAFAVSIFLAQAYAGFAFSVLWGWFIVPAFGAPPLSIAQAIGVAWTIHFISWNIKPSRESVDWDKVLKDGTINAIVKPSVALLFGWVISLFLA